MKHLAQAGSFDWLSACFFCPIRKLLLANPFFISIFAGLLLWSSGVILQGSYAQDLSAINQIARDGAPGLALKLLDEVQPVAAENPEGWRFFERQRVEIMRHWKQWDALITRLQKLPDTADDEFRSWAKLESVNAYLQQGKGSEARVMLRALIWRSQPPLVKADELALCRRLVIRSYLVENNTLDAQRAMLRYQQDYGNSGQAWRLLSSRLMLQVSRAEEVIPVLQGRAEPEAIALLLLAQLRAKQRTAESILAEARKHVQQNQLPVDQARFWVVAAEAAMQMHSPLTLIRTLEQSLLLSEHLPADDRVFQLDVDRLWQAYEAYAKDEGNQMQLLIGQDARWLELAAGWHQSNPEKAKSFYVMVMLYGETEEIRDVAADRFIELILKSATGMTVLKKLVLLSQRFETFSALPKRIRYTLIDDALANNDIDAATRLMVNLEKPPENSNAFEWSLRRARVMILGGDYQSGHEILIWLLDQQAELTQQGIDRVLQVIFDFQTIGKHREALVLFERMRKKPLLPQAHRELLFWMADSYRSLSELPLAAAFYLKSATLVDGFGVDPWGQTARFRAAEVLAEAGLGEDAQRIYAALLRITSAPDRQAVLKYKLQELRLKAEN